MMRATSLIALLFSTVVTTPLLAQEASEQAADPNGAAPATVAPADTPPAVPAALAAMTEKDRQAFAHYERGIQRYDDGEFALALVEFERAYAIRPGYRLLYNIGQVHYQLGHYAKARKAFERYLAEGKGEIHPERRAQVNSDLKALALRTAFIVVKANVAAIEVSIDDEDVTISTPGARLLVDAGNRRVVASKAGYSIARRSVSLAGGEVAVVELRLINLAPKSNVKPANTPAIVAWIGAGALAAGAIGTGVATVLADSEYDKMRRNPQDGSGKEIRSTLDRQADTVERLALVTDVLAGAAAVSGGVALYFTLRGTTARETPAPRASVGLAGREARFAIRF
jgi:hypothetical protein